ncbi:unnamed protein product [Nippostrongylus brasiliensis]|uniref:Uncharacterized protein n=1 Tax=Nippostrongylus brasiliensis TaxID=27835 RepID=A0A0N4XTC9_NIPBR|nr:hypothetical protein Q1695_004558 [Nippostrongylus brasiliensis]VDL69434.1 unnamed protein product [Nippostrongylus brasiliensis]
MHLDVSHQKEFVSMITPQRKKKRTMENVNRTRFEFNMKNVSLENGAAEKHLHTYNRSRNNLPISEQRAEKINDDIRALNSTKVIGMERREKGVEQLLAYLKCRPPMRTDGTSFLMGQRRLAKPVKVRRKRRLQTIFMRSMRRQQRFRAQNGIDRGLQVG